MVFSRKEANVICSLKLADSGRPRRYNHAASSTVSCRPALLTQDQKTTEAERNGI